LEKLIAERDRYRQRTIETRRAAAGAALIAVVDFIEAFEKFKAEGLAEPLEELSEALYDMFNGKSHPLLLVASPSHRPPEPLATTRLKVRAAGCMELLMRSGKSRDEAGRIVARRLTDVGATKPGRGDKSAITAGTVKEWRDQLTGPDDPENPSFARQRFRQLIKSAELLKTERGIEFGTQASNLLAGPWP
jgi:hypothetical protein